MNLRASLHFASRYVVRHRIQSVLLSLALGVVLALPLTVRMFAKTIEREMRLRAVATPQVLGARGSALDLMLAALYFRRQPIQPITSRDLDVIRESDLGEAIPLHVHFHAQDAPIVGTTLDYFGFRRLRFQAGHAFIRLGDCVVGANFAQQNGIKPGDAVFSSPEQVFDLAGVYPLKMRVAGVLAESHSPDDDAVFADVKTAWLIDGRAHGHDDLTRANSETAVLKREADNIVGNAAVRMFNEVTDANLDSFHFHGDIADYPVTAAIVLPRDAKSEVILAGRFQNSKSALQLIRPTDELDALLSTLFQIEGAVVAALLLVGIAAGAVAVIVFALSFKMRRREFATLEDIGISRSTLGWVKLFEIGLIGAAGLVVAAAVIAAFASLAPQLLLWSLR